MLLLLWSSVHMSFPFLQLDLQVNSHQDGGVVLDCDDLKDFYDITLEDIHRQLPGRQNCAGQSRTPGSERTFTGPLDQPTSPSPLPDNQIIRLVSLCVEV